MTNNQDPYQLRPEDVAEPPSTFLESFKRIGPGMILAASIVGSGELIATTTLGAKVGYTALWIILLSCFIKPAVQAEMGRYIIATGETGLESFNHFPGPRFKVNWIVWMWILMTLMTMFQVGAMFAGVSQVMFLLTGITVKYWVLIFLAITLALLLGGGYDRIEGIAMIKVGLFTMLTFMAAMLLIRMPQFFSWDAFLDGFKFKLPGSGFADAVAVFGITGVGASELFMYPYWCVEKGYARFTGKREDTPEWNARARGWIRVMHLDILSSMVIYTVATIAFYLLGAGVLHGMGLVPKDSEMISTLSNIYTQTLGGWSKWIFYVGAIVTLYGTIFASLAANTRIFADIARLMGFFRAEDGEARVRYRKGFLLTLSIVPIVLVFSFKDPVQMVRIGGISQAMMLPVIAIGALYLRYRRLPKQILPANWQTAGLWIAAIVIIWLMGYSVIEAIRNML